MRGTSRDATGSGVAIAALAETFDVPLDEAVRGRLEAFAALFIKWNQSINLASLKSEDELVTRHLADSFALAAMVGSDVSSAVDVGSGGGLPAIPLAVLLPSTSVVLFEPIRKKAAFLRTAVRELGLTGRVRVEAESVESPPAPALAARFDLALSRATLAPPDWLALGLGLVRSGGQVAVFAAGLSDSTLPPAAATRSYGDGRRLLLFRK